jgi:hypothetical protein
MSSPGRQGRSSATSRQQSPTGKPGPSCLHRQQLTDRQHDHRQPSQSNWLRANRTRPHRRRWGPHPGPQRTHPTQPLRTTPIERHRDTHPRQEPPREHRPMDRLRSAPNCWTPQPLRARSAPIWGVRAHACVGSLCGGAGRDPRYDARQLVEVPVCGTTAIALTHQRATAPVTAASRSRSRHRMGRQPTGAAALVSPRDRS